MKYVYQVEKENYEDAGKASTDIKRTLKTIGIDRRVLKAVAIACYEAEINIVIHSNGGTVTFEMDDDGKAVAKTNPVPGGNEDDARDAESSCPVNAISLD